MKAVLDLHLRDVPARSRTDAGIEKRHVLVTSAWFPSHNSTSGVFVKEQAEALARRGNKVAALIVDADNLRSLVNRRAEDRHRYDDSDLVAMLQPRIVFPVPYRFLTEPDRSYRRFIVAAAIRSVERYVRRHGPIDLIHHHCLSDNAYVARALSEHFGVPYVFTEHSNYWAYDELRCFNDFESREEHFDFVRAAAARIAVSNLRAEGYRKIFDAEFMHVPNLVSRSFEAPIKARARDGAFRFVCAAALEERKRQDLLLRAFAFEFKSEPVILTIVGNGPLEPDLRQLAASLGIADQVVFAGIQDREQMLAHFDAAHVQVLSSDQETFGIVLVEAMFRGIPVISTMSGGPEELVGAGLGLLTPVGDEAAMAKALRQIVDTYDSYDPEAIRAWAMSRYSEDAIAVRIESVYRDVCLAAVAIEGA